MPHDSEGIANVVPLIERAALVYKIDHRTGHAWVPRRNHQNGMAEVECLRCGLVLPIATMRDWDAEPETTSTQLDRVLAEAQEPCTRPGAPIRAMTATMDPTR